MCARPPPPAGPPTRTAGGRAVAARATSANRSSASGATATKASCAGTRCSRVRPRSRSPTTRRRENERARAVCRTRAHQRHRRARGRRRPHPARARASGRRLLFAGSLHAGDPRGAAAMSARVAKDHLRAYVERVERLDEEGKAISDDKRDVYAEAKANGFDVPALKRVIKVRRTIKEDGLEAVQESDAIYETYMHALGYRVDDGTEGATRAPAPAGEPAPTAPKPAEEPEPQDYGHSPRPPRAGWGRN